MATRPCDGPAPFSIQVTGDSGPFAAGKADLDLVLYAWSSTTGENDQPSVSQVIQLNGSK